MQPGSGKNGDDCAIKPATDSSIATQSFTICSLKISFSCALLVGPDRYAHTLSHIRKLYLTSTEPSRKTKNMLFNHRRSSYLGSICLVSFGRSNLPCDCQYYVLPVYGGCNTVRSLWAGLDTFSPPALISGEAKPEPTSNSFYGTDYSNRKPSYTV